MLRTPRRRCKIRPCNYSCQFLVRLSADAVGVGEGLWRCFFSASENVFFSKIRIAVYAFDFIRFVNQAVIVNKIPQIMNTLAFGANAIGVLKSNNIAYVSPSSALCSCPHCSQQALQSTS